MGPNAHSLWVTVARLQDERGLLACSRNRSTEGQAPHGLLWLETHWSTRTLSLAPPPFLRTASCLRVNSNSPRGCPDNSWGKETWEASQSLPEGSLQKGCGVDRLGRGCWATPVMVAGPPRVGWHRVTRQVSVCPWREWAPLP